MLAIKHIDIFKHSFMRKCEEEVFKILASSSSLNHSLSLSLTILIYFQRTYKFLHYSNERRISNIQVKK